MKNVNSLIVVNPRHLRIPLVTLEPMQGCGYAIDVTGVPDDCNGVYVVVFKPDGTHFAAYPLSQDANGDWSGEFLPTHFPTVGTAKYELFSKSAESGNTIPLGSGKVIVTAFDSGSLPVPTGSVIPVSEITDTTGVAHRIIAVNVGTAQNPDWTTQVEVQ